MRALARSSTCIIRMTVRGRWAEESLRLLLFSFLPVSSLFMALQTATSKTITKEQTQKQKAGARRGIQTPVYVVNFRFQN